MLSKWGIMSVEMQKAQLSDQSTQEDIDNYSYPDNIIDIVAKNIDEESGRIKMFIENASTVEDLNSIREQLEGAIDSKTESMIQDKENQLIINDQNN